MLTLDELRGEWFGSTDSDEEKLARLHAKLTAPPTTVAELESLLPQAAIEETENDRKELVIYTGWSDDSGTLVPMGDD